MKKTLTIVSLLLSGALALPADKPNREQGREDREDRQKGKHERKEENGHKDAGAVRRSHGPVIFQPGEREIISDYYLLRELPPGLAKRNGGLSPGLEKQLRRNGRLPPGLEKRITPLPPQIEDRLSRLPTGVKRGTIGNRAIIYEPRTRLILDFFPIQ